MRKRVFFIVIILSIFFACEDQNVNKDNNEYTITYIANGGNGVMVEQKVKGGEKIKLNKNNFTRDNFSFKGWSTKASSNSVDYTDEVEITMPSSDLTLYAFWKSNTTSEEDKIIFLHHSTGKDIWNGGNGDNVPKIIANYNLAHNTNIQISKSGYPSTPSYGWQNYPYDYWNIWVNHGEENQYKGQDTLIPLTTEYDVIIWKHCYPVSDVLENGASSSISSDTKTVANYKLQYEALKIKMKEYANTKFIVWTGAARVKSKTNEANANRAKAFFYWVVNEWDEKGDNIYIFDFRKLETEGGLYLKEDYAKNSSDSHPNSDFSEATAPKFVNRIINVVNGVGDNTSLTGE